MGDESDEGLPPEIFQELLAKYLAGVPNRLKDIEDAIESLRKNPSKEALLSLRFLVHKLAGNAGTFGFGKVTETSRKWEERLTKMGNEYPKCKMDPIFFSELDLYMNEIRSEFKNNGR